MLGLAAGHCFKNTYCVSHLETGFRREILGLIIDLGVLQVVFFVSILVWEFWETQNVLVCCCSGQPDRRFGGREVNRLGGFGAYRFGGLMAMRFWRRR